MSRALEKYVYISIVSNINMTINNMISIQQLNNFLVVQYIIY